MTAFWVLIVGIILIPTLFIVALIYDNDSRINDKKKCDNCQIVSRRGNIILHNIRNNTDDHCPHCEKRSIFWSADSEPSPLAPKFSLRQCRTISKLEDKAIEDKAIDIQMKNYLKLQQKKLDKMKKESSQ